MMNRVAITGYGIADPLGANIDECFKNMLNDYNPMILSDRYDLGKYNNIKVKLAASLNPNNIYNLSRCSKEQNRPIDYIKIALHVVNQALDTANLQSTENAAVIFSSLCSDSNTRIAFVNALETGKLRYSPKAAIEHQPDYISGCICSNFEISGPNLSINGACATGLMSLDYAKYLIEEYDYVIVGGSDIMTGPANAFLFQQYQALTDNISQPFDKNRNGFLSGEGAACLILESEKKAKKRGAVIYGFLSGIGITSEINSALGVNKDAAKMAIKKALNTANLTSVDFVNAHATSTIQGDEIEYKNIIEILPNTPIFSAKGKIGHTMAPCGIIEIIYGLAVFKYGIIPRNFNLKNPLANDSNLLINNLQKKCKSFLKNSYGFGGRCASVIITAPD